MTVKTHCTRPPRNSLALSVRTITTLADAPSINPALAWVSVPIAAAPLPNISQSLWSPVWLQQLLSQHGSLSCLSPSQNARLWLFCFWILVNIFILILGGPDLWWGVINNICPIWYLFTLRQEVGGGGGGGWVPFLKFTWTCVQTTWRGRATVKVCESDLPPWTLQTDSYSLAHLSHIHPSAFMLFHRQLYQQQL